MTSINSSCSFPSATQWNYDWVFFFFFNWMQMLTFHKKRTAPLSWSCHCQKLTLVQGYDQTKFNLSLVHRMQHTRFSSKQMWQKLCCNSVRQQRIHKIKLLVPNLYTYTVWSLEIWKRDLMWLCRHPQRTGGSVLSEGQPLLRPHIPVRSCSLVQSQSTTSSADFSKRKRTRVCQSVQNTRNRSDATKITGMAKPPSTGSVRTETYR